MKMDGWMDGRRKWKGRCGINSTWPAAAGKQNQPWSLNPTIRDSNLLPLPHREHNRTPTKMKPASDWRSSHRTDVLLGPFRFSSSDHLIVNSVPSFPRSGPAATPAGTMLNDSTQRGRPWLHPNRIPQVLTGASRSSWGRIGSGLLLARLACCLGPRRALHRQRIIPSQPRLLLGYIGGTQE
ncbi:hypothetical protein BO94DRAFT_161599 [Aspergillus sclerotioniger CBS 115572]|uniref:Uncharacterized protein n=1 Tax=Aspergillus sclerotioniger CBS 115572 TaxID=1450535 RepID=A0A317W544_9EURO|nr:hypothetical protein BO94DRAFT_161599 [Aspergillus sclerotioniger CBS 115572]PWY80442.1 hypothetical protein BO94DRAFT_161599 [Aspergillus sclerotioniger CBS 115572]